MRAREWEKGDGAHTRGGYTDRERDDEEKKKKSDKYVANPDLIKMKIERKASKECEFRNDCKAETEE